MRPVPAVILLIVGVAAVAADVLYLMQPAHLLPTFILGHAAHVVGKHPKHRHAGMSLGAVLVVIALVVTLSGSRRRQTLRS